MDSLTQIILGAAVGEATLGRKIGSRAMLWGGFAGFLPDFDVSASFVMDEISALAVHRGITHSIFFAVFFSMLIAFLVQKLYSSGLYQRKRYKITSSVLVTGVLVFTANYLPYMVTNAFNPKLFFITVAIALGILFLMNRFYFQKQQEVVETNFKDWYILFFFAIITHPLLDCFTAYGTQLFLPFSDYRVAFNIIAVADPLYTVPFLICLITAANLRSGTNRRAIVNWTGLILSLAYLLFCFTNKQKVNQVFEQAFANEGIAYSRYQTTPMILNNILWQGLAESDSAFYHGYYSLMQEDEEVEHFNVFNKQHELLDGYQDDETYKTLQWFSKDYYSVVALDDGGYQLNDLRFGIFTPTYESDDDYIFKFILEEKDGSLAMHQSTDGPDITKDTFKDLWERIMAK